ncbi:spore germination protein [Scopulibacillus cellulosilyticus]|uniref:Spore germination protein n=1 Tax=Scopulibacillus cellulosilyticus TaxID=2665665 RepID=A0ABW2PSA1_9BACL
MGNLIQEIQEKFIHNDDFFIQKEKFGNTVLHLIGFKTLVDLDQSKLYIQQIARSSTSVHNLLNNLSETLDANLEYITKALLKGKLVIIVGNGKHNAVIEPVSLNLKRIIDEPKSESPILASLDAFVEDIKANVGLIRKWLNTDRLCHYSYEVGKLQKRKISMLYINGCAQSSLVERVDQQLKNIQSDIETIDDLNRCLGYGKRYIVSHLYSTELPNQAVHYLKRNRIVIFLDNHPYALVFPQLIWDMFSLASDRNFPFMLALMLRSIRVIGAVTTLTLPALYVALISVNPEVLKIDFALFVAKSRQGVPYPALLETILMVFLVDLVLEAIVRLPKSVGPAVTMVGGVILGQAVVEAKLVSNLLIIVITAIVIAGSTIVGMQNSIYIRLLRYPVLILASIYGIFGAFIGVTFIGIYLTSLTSNGFPYTAFNLKQKGDTK